MDIDLKKMPNNLGRFKTPLGFLKSLERKRHYSRYMALLGIVNKAAEELAKVDIHVEVIDVQSLLPFDTNHLIVESLKKTNRYYL